MAALKREQIRPLPAAPIVAPGAGATLPDLAAVKAVQQWVNVVDARTHNLLTRFNAYFDSPLSHIRDYCS